MTEHAMPDVAPNTADLFEIMRTTRSMRRLKPDPVPNELIRKILEAGVCAPSGGLDRDASDALKPVLGDDTGVVGGATGDHRYPFELDELKGQLGQMHGPGRGIDQRMQRVADDRGLLENLLLHEVAVVALADQSTRPAASRIGRSTSLFPASKIRTAHELTTAQSPSSR